MKRNLIILSLAFVLINACQSKNESKEHNHDTASPSEVVAVDTIKKSVPKEVHEQLGNAHVMIKYHAPAVRNRTIWGGLVPYGEVWVTGAHNATSIEIDKNFTIDGKVIPAGKYALFTIPGKDKWTIILNKNWDQHLADKYDAKEDVSRVEVIPEQLATVQERLNYAVVSTGDSKANVEISWEKIKVLLPITIN